MLSCHEGDEKILVQSLSPLKTRAKDDEGKTYWIYLAEDNVSFGNKDSKIQLDIGQAKIILIHLLHSLPI